MEVGFEEFRVEVQDATCALCHGDGSPLPNWSSFEVANAACDDIRERVLGDGSMPPPGVEFSDQQRLIVDVWTSDGCPEGGD